jgi:hypothetical protein
VDAKQGLGPAVENVERGAGPRIDLKEMEVLAIDQEIGAAEPFEIKALGYALHRVGQTRF